MRLSQNNLTAVGGNRENIRPDWSRYGFWKSAGLSPGPGRHMDLTVVHSTAFSGLNRTYILRIYGRAYENGAIRSYGSCYMSLGMTREHVHMF